MKVTIEFGEELTPAVQQSLEQGTSVQKYIRAALMFFNEMKKAEKEGMKCGFGDSSRFRTYNTEISPTAILHKIENGEYE